MKITDLCLQQTYAYSYIKVSVGTTQVHYTEVPVGTTELICLFRSPVGVTELTHIQKYPYVLQIRTIHHHFLLFILQVIII